MRETYQGRADAGRRLAARLAGTHGEDVVVLGLPRGGVLVAAEAAAALGAPPDVIVVRKLGVSFQPDLAMGAGEGAGSGPHRPTRDLAFADRGRRRLLSGLRPDLGY